MPVSVGQIAPDFTLYDADRKLRKLSEFRGKNVVLSFFPGAFSGVCTKEACTFRDSTADFNRLNAQVVGVTVDSPFANKAWAEANQLAFPILSDFDRKTTREYDVLFIGLSRMEGYTSSNRAVFLLDKDGNVHYKWVGKHPGEEPSYQEIAQALAKLN
ncbi:MAG: peroxiredoxin [Dehalococcoidia bacterium]|nr:peroxiredoxin [Dehalococcoidia bacterium]